MPDDRPAPRAAPCGAWVSPIDAALVARAGVALTAPRPLPAGATAWLEGRPSEGGRVVLVRAEPDGATADVTPPGTNVRTRVHEYGGGACTVAGDVVFYVDFADQRLYRLDPGAAPRAITPAPPRPGAARYADCVVTPDGATLIAVEERDPDGGGEAVNALVAIPTDGSAPPRVLAAGADFYSTPRLAPDGRRLAWLSWDHPRMPWDGTDLWVAEWRDGVLGPPAHVAGGAAESVFQPAWSPDGVLHFVSDRTGWWNLYAWRDGAAAPLAPMEAECGAPQWSFDAGTYDFLADGRVLCVVRDRGEDRLVLIDPRGGGVTPVATPFSSIGRPRVSGERAVFVAASPTRAAAVVALDVATGAIEVLRRSLAVDVDPGYLSVPEAIAFPTTGGATAHALYYAPRNRDYVAPPGERPPLLVLSHGGPTGAADGGLSLRVQFWTSRGFAVVDVDYRGSTGYGRAYRDALRGAWGVADVDDCVAAARFLAARGEVDGARMAIRGGSAGGYTTLAALAFRDAFAAGASYYGIGDLETLATDTHKFESRYLDGLVGPYPAARDVYVARSPIHHVDGITCPVILLQGLEDRVVPPAQAESMAASLRARGVPYAYLPFAGEQHGFRRAETIRRAQEAELWFYGRVLGFTPADDIAPVTIVGDLRPRA